MDSCGDWLVRLVNGPCIAGAHHPVMVIKFTGAVTMYGQIRRASAGTGCFTSRKLQAVIRPSGPDVNSRKLQASSLTSNKLDDIGIYRRKL